MLHNLAYVLGKHWKLTGIVVVVFIVIGCWPETKNPPTSAIAIPPKIEPSCLENQAMLLAYEQYIEKKEYWKAYRSISICADKTGDPALKEKARIAEAASREDDAKNSKINAADRLDAIEKLRLLDPEKAKEMQTLAKNLELIIKKEKDIKDRAYLAELKSQGVSIGMTSKEVLLSSWGKPNKINRTINSYGTREQWVYDGGYLYFKDGILETIQN